MAGAESLEGVEMNSVTSEWTLVVVLRGVFNGERKGLESVDEARLRRRRFSAGEDMILVL